MSALLLLALLVQEPAPAPPPFAPLDLALANGPAAWGDVDGDGWVDLNAGGQVWRNDEGAGFTKLADVAPGLFGDLDGDGDLDVFAFGDQRLFAGDGAGGFAEVALEGLARTHSRGAALGDFDGHGHLDAYVGGYENWNDQVTFPDHLLRGDGASLALAWSETRFRARGVTACDYDTDGDLDVYVSNYRLLPNVLWRNDGAGAFEDVAAAANAVATSEGFGGGHSIGACWGDFDGDGRFDLFAGNFAHVDSRGDQPKSRFLRQKEDGTFEDKGTCGVWYQESYASPAAADFDNDGDLDLYFTTVYGTASFGRKNHPVLYRNDGDWTFTDVTEELGLAGLLPTYQAAWADVDHDGDVDLVTAGNLFRNSAAQGHWLRVEVARAPAIGAQVRAKLPGGRVVTRQVEAGTGEGNANEPTLHLGLGDHDGPVELEVRWPGGEPYGGHVKTVQVPGVDRRVVVTIGER